MMGIGNEVQCEENFFLFSVAVTLSFDYFKPQFYFSFIPIFF